MRTMPRIAVFSLLAALVITPVHLRGAEATPDEPHECQLVVEEAGIARQAAPLELEVKLAEELGSLTQVEAQPESGLAVIEITQAEPPTATILLDTSEAKEGTWVLTFRGEGGACWTHLAVA